MNIAVWLPALACLSLVIYLISQRTSGSKDTSARRLALLVGARRVWGESDESLRRRSIALSRWPDKNEVPVLVWWARLWGRIWRRDQ